MSYTPNNYSIAAIIMTIGIIDKNVACKPKFLVIDQPFPAFRKL